jgi:histidyl-tRNA synthetase
MLLKNLGDVDLPALGFGMGDVVLGEILKKKQWSGLNLKGLRVQLVIADEKFRPQAMSLLQELRSWFGVEYPFQAAKVGKQFQAAEERGCDVAIVIDQQIEEGVVEVKVLATREQTKVRTGVELMENLSKLELKKHHTAAGLPEA